MLEEFDNMCARHIKTDNEETKKVIERRILHVRSFMLKCGVNRWSIEEIEEKYNL